MRGGDSSPQRAGRRNKSDVPAAPLPATTKSQKIEAFLVWDLENERNLLEEIIELEEAIKDLIAGGKEHERKNANCINLCFVKNIYR